MTDQSTQDKILKAARQLFVEYGFSGTSMGKIAKLAEVNHSLLFHHFGNKQKLWLAVKQNIVKDAKSKAPTLPSTDLSFHDFLQQLVENSFNFYRDNPDIMRMISWQRMESGVKDIGITLSHESQAWLDAIKHYQNAGHINPKLKPEYIFTFILSVVSSAAFERDNIFIGDDQQDYLQFCVDRLLQALHAFS